MIIYEPYMAKSPLIMCENKPWLPAQKPFLTKAYISALVNLNLNTHLLSVHKELHLKC